MLSNNLDYLAETDPDPEPEPDPTPEPEPDTTEDTFQLDQSGDDVLRKLGLVHEHRLHIDVINNETGFALYLDSPFESELFDFYDGQGKRPVEVHHTEYDPAAPIVYSEPGETALLYAEITYLQIRELDEDGSPGEWHRIPVTFEEFRRNNPPDVLEDLGFDRFDTVTWLEGLEENKQYEVQLWFDGNGNGELDREARYERQVYTHHNGNTGVTTTHLTEHYYWTEADYYSGIHVINTNSEAFDVDIDGDGTMDFFADVEVVDTDVGSVTDDFLFA